MRPGGLRDALRALAHGSQIVPGINPAGMAIVPIETNGISSDRVGIVWPYWRFVYGQSGFRFRSRLTWLAARGFAFIDTGRARASVPQPLKRPVTCMSIRPLYGHAGTASFVHLNMPWPNGITLQISFFCCLSRYIFRGDANAFVAHTTFLHRRDGTGRGCPAGSSIYLPEEIRRGDAPNHGDQ